MHLTESDFNSIQNGDVIYEAANNNQTRRLQYIGVLTCLATNEQKHTFISDYLTSTLTIDAKRLSHSISIRYKRLFYTENETAERLKQNEPLLPG